MEEGRGRSRKVETDGEGGEKKKEGE
jgi:hypothetical protein